MEDYKCVRFLQWGLPKLDLRWRGFRKVRRQVCKRIDRRIIELKLDGVESYRTFLEDNPEEWQFLDRFCRITISRFYRDSVVFDYLTSDVFPDLIRTYSEKHFKSIRVWCAGCASGEEPYTIAILWHESFHRLFPELHLEIVATDNDPGMLERAKAACYPTSSLRELPSEWVARAFHMKKGLHTLKQPYKKYVKFELLDIREKSPRGIFQVVFCRNLAFTYFEQALQAPVLDSIYYKLARGGVLITGKHELNLPDGSGFISWVDDMPIFLKT